jgi:hypothetical protein
VASIRPSSNYRPEKYYACFLTRLGCRWPQIETTPTSTPWLKEHHYDENPTIFDQLVLFSFFSFFTLFLNLEPGEVATCNQFPSDKWKSCDFSWGAWDFPT